MNSFFLQFTKGDWALDKVIAIIVLCASIAFIAWSISLKHYDVVVPGIFLVSSLLYLLLRKRLSIDAQLPHFKLGDRFGLLSHIIFIVCLSLSVWLVWNNLYYRPPLYFVLLLVAAASIIWDILSLNQAKRSDTFVALFKIIALSLTVYAGIYYQFPEIYGVDPWVHNEWIQETVNIGRITQGQFVNNSYYLFPIFHLAGAAIQIVTGLSTYSSIFVTYGVLIAVSCLFVFLIGRKLVSTKVGLLAAFIVPLTANTIERGTAIIPMSLGFFFFAAILYLVFCPTKKKVSVSLLVIILSATLILTHTIAALVMLISLFFVFVGIKFYKRTTKIIIPYEAVSLTFILLFGVGMLFCWMRAPPNEPSFFDISITHLTSALQLDVGFVLLTPPTAPDIPYAVEVLNEGGYLLLLAFAIVGALIYLFPKNRSALRTALVFTAAAIFAIPFISQNFALAVILPSRWFIFLYVPLSILAVCGLLSISNLIKGRIGKLGMITVVMLAITFMITTNSIANGDSPQVFNGATRFGYTQSEVTAIKTLSQTDWGRPETDIYYGSIFPFVIGPDKYRDMVDKDNGIFIMRNYYLHHPEWDDRYMTKIHHGGIGNVGEEQVLISDYVKERGIDAGPLVYDNGRVRAYAITPVK